MTKTSGTEKRRLKKLVNVRVPDAVADAIKVQAKAQGITDASLIRALIVEHLPETDPADTLPVRRARATPFVPPPDIVHELDHAREVAAEATGMLKMAAQRYRETGMTEQHGDAEAVLLAMREASTVLLHLHADITARWRAYHSDMLQ